MFDFIYCVDEVNWPPVRDTNANVQASALGQVGAC